MKKSGIVAILVMMILCAFVTACGDKEPAPAPEIVIDVTAKANMYVGDSQTLTVNVTKDGAPVTEGVQISVTSGDAVSVSGNTVTALKAGQAVICVTYMTASEETTVTVSDLVSVNFEQDTVEFKTMDIAKNNRIELGVEGILNGQPMTDEQIGQLDWTTDNEEIAVVEDGALIAKKGGTVTVSVSYQGQSGAQCTVNIVDYTGYTKIATKADLLAAGKSGVEETMNLWGEDKTVTVFRQYFVLTEDIDLGGMVLTGDDSNIFNGYFLGIFDGNGHTISGFSVEGAYSSLFGNVGGNGTTPNSGYTGLVKDLTAECTTYRAKLKSAVLAATAWGNGVIENCFVSIDNIDLSEKFYNPESKHEGAAFSVVNVYNGGTVRNCVEVGNWQCGENIEGVRRIAYMQNDGLIENNVSVMRNLPSAEEAPATGVTVIDYEQADIDGLMPGEKTTVKLALPGYRLETASADETVFTVDAEGGITAVGKGNASVILKIVTLSGGNISANGRAAAIRVPVTVYGGLRAPAEYSYNGSTVSWSAVANAEKYTVKVIGNGTTQEFTDIIATSYDLRALLTAAGEYTVQVQAIDANGGTDGYSTEFRLTAISTIAEVRKITEKSANYILINNIDLQDYSFNTEGNNPLVKGKMKADSVLDGNGYGFINVSVSGWHYLFNEIKGEVRNINMHVKSINIGASGAPLFNGSYGGKFNNITIRIDSVVGASISSGYYGGLMGVKLGAETAGGQFIPTEMRNCTIIANWTRGEVDGNFNVFGKSEVQNGKPTCIMENCAAVLFNAPSNINAVQTGATLHEYAQTDLRLLVGETATLGTASGLTVTYTVQDPTVASVTDGAIQGLKAGSTEVTATLTAAAGVLKDKEIQYTFTVAVLTGALAPTEIGYNGSVVTWNAVDGANTYTVSVAKDDDTAREYTEIATNSYDLKEILTASGVYTIKVKAYDDDGSAGYSEAFVLTGILKVSDFAAIKGKANVNAVFVGNIDLDGVDWNRQNQFAGELKASSVIDGNGYGFINTTVGEWHSIFGKVQGTIRNMNIHVEAVNLANTCAPLFSYSFGCKIENVTITIDSVVGTQHGGNSGLMGITLNAEQANNQFIQTEIRNCKIIANWTSGEVNENFNVFGAIGANVNDKPQCIVSGCSVILLNAPETINALPDGATLERATCNLAPVVLTPTATAECTATAPAGYAFTHSIADESVATVQDGTITGVSAGFTYLTVQLTKGGETVMSIDIPVTVGDAVAADLDYNGSTILWKAVDSAASYGVFVTRNGKLVREFAPTEALKLDIASALVKRGEYNVGLKLYDAAGKTIGYTETLTLTGISTVSDFAAIKGKANVNALFVGNIDLNGLDWDKQNQFAGNLDPSSVIDGNGYGFINTTVGAWHSIFAEVKGIIRNMNMHVKAVNLGSTCAPLFAYSYGCKVENVTITIDSVVGTTLSGNNYAGLMGVLLKAETGGDQFIQTEIRNCTIDATWTRGEVNGNFNLFGKIDTVDGKPTCILENNTVNLYNVSETVKGQINKIESGATVNFLTA